MPADATTPTDPTMESPHDSAVTDLIARGKLACTQVTAGERCLGKLVHSETGLRCEVCRRDYPNQSGVTVCRDNLADDWFEEMYSGRSREEQVQSAYLRTERDAVANFLSQHGAGGPSLEIGCGVCLFGEILPEYIGLEWSLNALLQADLEPFGRICGDATALPFAADTFGVIATFNTLEHVPRVDAAFREIDRVLCAGGLLFLKPAWHCTRWKTQLVDVLPYSQLTPWLRMKKALLPILKSRLLKLFQRLPPRLLRRLTARGPIELKFTALDPYHGPLWSADADACASIDSHEGILFFVSRGYQCLSHPRTASQILAGHDLVILRKPAATP